MKFLPLLFLPVLIACNTEPTPTTAAPPPAVDEPEIARALSFEDSVAALPASDAASLQKAVAAFQSQVSNDSMEADQAAVVLMNFVDRLTDTLNRQLVRQESTLNPERRKAELATQHFRLQGNGEGFYEIVPDYDWMIPLISPKTSGAVDDYLAVIARQQTAPPLLDGGLAVEMSELVDRALQAERLVGKQLPPAFAEDAKNISSFLTNVVLFGSDNSPAMEWGSNKFRATFATAHASVLRNHAETELGRKVKEWRTVVSSGDSVAIDRFRTEAHR